MALRPVISTWIAALCVACSAASPSNEEKAAKDAALPANTELPAPKAEVKSDANGEVMFFYVPPKQEATLSAADSTDTRFAYNETSLKIFADSLAEATVISLRRTPTMATVHAAYHLKASTIGDTSANVAVMGKGVITHPLELVLTPVPDRQGQIYQLSVYQLGTKTYLEAKPATIREEDGKVVIPVSRWGIYQAIQTPEVLTVEAVELFDQEAFAAVWKARASAGEPYLVNATAVLAATLGVHAETPPSSPLCKDWILEPEILGQLPQPSVNESSGLALSSDKKNLYHVNDSGGKSSVFVTNLDGTDVREVAITGAAFVDIEALALGPCPEAIDKTAKCLYVADIGNNKLDRKQLPVYVIKEESLTAATAEIVKTMHFVYTEGGQGKRDAEAFAVHPMSGEFFVATKSLTPDAKAFSWESIFRLTEAAEGSTPEAPTLLTSLGSVNLVYKPTSPPIAPMLLDTKSLASSLLAAPRLGDHFVHSKITTDMAIRPDGKALAVLTYGNVLEVSVDLSKVGSTFPDKNTKPGIDYRVVAISKPGAQQEALTYDVDGRSLLVTSEAVETDMAPKIRRIRCRTP